MSLAPLALMSSIFCTLPKASAGYRDGFGAQRKCVPCSGSYLRCSTVYLPLSCVVALTSPGSPLEVGLGSSAWSQSTPRGYPPRASPWTISW